MKPLDEINSDKKTELSDLIQNAIGRIQSNITVEKVSETLSHKYDLHNKMVCGKRCVLPVCLLLCTTNPKIRLYEENYVLPVCFL